MPSPLHTTGQSPRANTRRWPSSDSSAHAGAARTVKAAVRAVHMEGIINAQC